MATNTSAITTAEQLWAANRDHRCELVRGELVIMSPAGDRHGIIGGVSAAYLGYYIEENDLGDVLVGEPGFLIERGPDTVLAPDIAFISRERRAKGCGFRCTRSGLESPRLFSSDVRLADGPFRMDRRGI